MVSTWKESTNLDVFTVKLWKLRALFLKWCPVTDDTVTCGGRKMWKLSVVLGSVRECTVRLVNCWLFACPAFMLCRKKKSEGKIIRTFIFKKGLNYTVKPHYSRIPYLTIFLLVQIYCNCIPRTFQILFNLILRCIHAGLQLLGSCLDATPLTLSRLGCQRAPCKQAFCSLSQLSFSPPCC